MFSRPLEIRLSESKHECFLQSGWSPVWKQCIANQVPPTTALEIQKRNYHHLERADEFIVLPAFQIKDPSSFFFDIKKYWEQITHQIIGNSVSTFASTPIFTLENIIFLECFLWKRSLKCYKERMLGEHPGRCF